MYAVIKTGGKQYRVKAGDVLVVEKLDGEPGAKVAFDQVLMVGEGSAVTVGAPTIAGASVSATLIETCDGEVNLTPKALLNLRARNLDKRAEAPVAKAPKAEPAPKPEAKAAAPKKA